MYIRLVAFAFINVIMLRSRIHKIMQFACLSSICCRHISSRWFLNQRPKNVRSLVFPHYNGPLEKCAIMRLEVDDENKKEADVRLVGW